MMRHLVPKFNEMHLLAVVDPCCFCASSVKLWKKTANPSKPLLARLGVDLGLVNSCVFALFCGTVEMSVRNKMFAKMEEVGAKRDNGKIKATTICLQFVENRPLCHAHWIFGSQKNNGGCDDRRTDHTVAEASPHRIFRFRCMDVKWVQFSELPQVSDKEELAIWKGVVLDSTPMMSHDQLTTGQFKSMCSRRLFGKHYAQHMAREVNWLAGIFKDLKVSRALDMSLGMGCSMFVGMYSEPPLQVCGLASNDARRAMVGRILGPFCTKTVVDEKHKFWHEAVWLRASTICFRISL